MLLPLIALLAAGQTVRPLVPVERSIIETAVRQELSDPASATFRAFPVPANAKVYCGTVNSKNRMGGYAGPMLFKMYITRNAAGRITGVSQVVVMDDSDEPIMHVATAQICTNQGYPVGS